MFPWSYSFGFVLFTAILHISDAALSNGMYAIQNQEDKSFLESQSQVREIARVKTAPKKDSRSQHWRLVTLGSNKYGLANDLTEENEVSKAARQEKDWPGLTRFTLIPVGGGDVFLIQKLLYHKYSRGPAAFIDACLLSQGAGARVAFFARCETHSRNQQWRFTQVAKSLIL